MTTGMGHIDERRATHYRTQADSLGAGTLRSAFAMETASANLRAAMATAGLTDLEPDVQQAIHDAYTEYLDKTREHYALHGLMDDDPDAMASIGQIASGPLSSFAAQLEAALNASGKDKNKKDDLFRILMMQALEEQIHWLDERIAQLDRKIAEQEQTVHDLEVQMEARYGPDWRKKLLNHELDDDPLAQRLLHEQDTLDAIRRERDRYQAERNALAERIRTLDKGGAEYEGANAVSREMVDIAVERLTAQRSQAVLEGHLPEGGEEHRYDAENKEDIDELFSGGNTGSLEEEIAHAMRQAAGFRAIDNPDERLIAEYDLVKGLSPKAREILSQEEGIKALFEMERYESLGAPSPEGPSAPAAGAKPAGTPSPV